MPTLHLMIGLPCSGKTTLAKKLEAELGALRLTADEWHLRLFGQDADHPEHDVRHGNVEDLQWRVAAWTLVCGKDVILDFGMWQRSEREDFRARAEALGAGSVIHFLDVAHDELFERLDRRNAEVPDGAMRIPSSMLRGWIPYFEAPDEKELLAREAGIAASPPQRSSTLHLICGLPGTGKTTLAKKLEEQHRAMRFCPDDWIVDIWTADRAMDEGNLFRDKIEELQWSVAKRALSIGVDVVIEWGTWGRPERERLRDEARALSAQVAFYYLSAERDTMKQRILHRNKERSRYEFVLNETYLEAHLDDWIRTMQVPTDEELATYDWVSN